MTNDKVFLVKTIREPVSDNPFPKEDFNVIELTPSDLELIETQLNNTLNEILIHTIENDKQIQNLLKKLSEVSKC